MLLPLLLSHLQKRRESSPCHHRKRFDHNEFYFIFEINNHLIIKLIDRLNLIDHFNGIKVLICFPANEAKGCAVTMALFPNFLVSVLAQENKKIKPKKPSR